MDHMTADQALDLTREMLDDNGLPHWVVKFDNSKTRAGMCNHYARSVQFSRPTLAAVTYEEALDTICHEVAHAVVGIGHAHDYVWRAKAIALGGSGRRCTDNRAIVNPAALEGEYRGTCPTCGRTVKTMHRKPRVNRSCSKCGHGQFNSDHLIQWSYKGRPVLVAA